MTERSRVLKATVYRIRGPGLTAVAKLSYGHSSRDLFHSSIAFRRGDFREKICSTSLLVRRFHAGGGLRPIDRNGHDRRADRRHRRPHQGCRRRPDPDTTKAKAVITQELIDRQSIRPDDPQRHQPRPGRQLHQLDPYGSSGGNIRIRGFDGNRISLTFDGVPLNDSGNYAIFSNQQLDPELIEQVNVGLGSTDVDLPTASAAGGTVNYRTDHSDATSSARACRLDRRLRLSSALFGMINTGEFTPFGTKAWSPASQPQRQVQGPGRDQEAPVQRAHLPAARHATATSSRSPATTTSNRNNFYRNPSSSDLRGSWERPRSFPMPTRPPTIRSRSAISTTIRSTGHRHREPRTATDGSGAGVAQNAGGTDHNGTGPERHRPIRRSCEQPLNARAASTARRAHQPVEHRQHPRPVALHLTDSLILTVDPSFQYVLANGGGTPPGGEQPPGQGRQPGPPRRGLSTAMATSLDTIRFYTPEQHQHPPLSA